MVAVPLEAESPSASVCFSGQTWSRGRRRCPWCQRPYPYSRHQMRSPGVAVLATLTQHCATLELRPGAVPRTPAQGPKQDRLVPWGSACWQPREHATTCRSQAPVWREVLLPLCLDPLGMPVVVPSVPFCLRANSRHSLDSCSVRVSSLSLQFISERTLIGGLKKIGCPSSLLT